MPKTPNELLKQKEKQERKVRRFIVNLRNFRYLYLEGKKPDFSEHIRGLESFLLDLIWKEDNPKTSK